MLKNKIKYSNEIIRKNKFPLYLTVTIYKLYEENNIRTYFLSKAFKKNNIII